MRLRAWRETWMWLAVSACGGAAARAPAWMKQPTAPQVSIFNAPPLAGATYVATVEQGDFGRPGPHVGIERGTFQCRQLVELMQRNERIEYPQDQPEEPVVTEAKRTCDVATAKLLRQGGGFLFVVDGGGPRWLSAQQVLAAAQPIDTPAKALLAVWAAGTYDIGWGDGGHYYGDPEHGIVRAVPGGFEVIASTSVTDSQCGGAKAREVVTNYRHTLFVDGAGQIHEREKIVSDRYDIADPCHPLGRRPTDFADVASGGTVRGYLLRAMHHEAESVRAFERIARELRAHGAPDELCRGADDAARDEYRHAERCAWLAGVPVAIAHDELPVRSLRELAIDNAREGCVGESYAALVATVQAKAALLPALREHFAAIAVDELAHAALAHAIASWIEPRLSVDEREAVRAARVAALHELAAGCAPPATVATRALGMPDAATAAGLVQLVAAANF
jgi:hypothetical protein